MANLISQIETKEATQHQQPMTGRNNSAMPEWNSSPKKPVQHDSRGSYNHSSNPANTVQYHKNTSSVCHPTSQTSPPLSPSTITRPQLHSHHIPPCLPSPLYTPVSPSSTISPFSPSHTRPLPPSLARPHPMSPKSPSPQLPYSPSHSYSMSPHTTSHPSHAEAMHHSHQQSFPHSPSVTSPTPSQHAISPPLFHAPPLLPDEGRHSLQSSSSPTGFHDRSRNPPTLHQHAGVSPASPTSHHSTHNGRANLRERDQMPSLTSAGESDTNSQENSLPDLLSSSSPKSELKLDIKY